jgi:ABC-type transporter Mla subunit MlaD
MNRQRRKDIQSVIDRLQGASDILSDALTDVEGIRDEEQDYLDAMPENMQSSDRGEKTQEAIDYLEQVISSLEDVDTETMIQTLEEAMA